MPTLRKATLADVPALNALIARSARILSTQDYRAPQIEGALRGAFGVDTQLLADETYFVVEDGGQLVGCGGWSRRKTLYGGDQFAGREDSFLDPARDAAKIRAFFVHPQWARQGIGSLILDACEKAAIAAGFTRLEMGATLSGVAFYHAKGYAEIESQSVPLSNGERLAIVRMSKKAKS